MVEKVEAWKADDGNIFTTEMEAVQRNVFNGLQTLDFLNEAGRRAIMDNAVKLAELLAPLADLQRAQGGES